MIEQIVAAGEAVATTMTSQPATIMRRTIVAEDEIRIRSRLLNKLGFTVTTTVRKAAGVAATSVHPGDGILLAAAATAATPPVHNKGNNDVHAVSMLEHEGPRRRISLNDSQNHEIDDDKDQDMDHHRYHKFLKLTRSSSNYNCKHILDNIVGPEITVVAEVKVKININVDNQTERRQQQCQQQISDLERRHQKASNKRIVRFSRDVTVQPIASHRQFSKRIRRTLWTSSDELQDIAYRNTMEFSSEGYDATKVLEDDDMYIDATTFEKIHPYWIDQQRQQQGPSQGHEEGGDRGMRDAAVVGDACFVHR